MKFGQFMSLGFISRNNSRYYNQRDVSLTGTDHCNSKLSQNIHFEKRYSIFSLKAQKICEKNQIPKVVFCKNCPFPLNP